MTSDWQTHAEKTDYRQTANYADTIAFARQLAGASPAIEYRSFGHSGQGRELPLLIASETQTFTPEDARAQGKAVVLIQGCIHSGEPDGKDAGFALLRDIAITKTAAGILENVVLLFIPLYNTDGHERSTPYNRINQNGPESMGWRTTSTYQNLNRDYAAAIRRLHDTGVMINGSFVFGMDDDDDTVFDRTVEWAIEQGIETATFHILTPYPGTALYQRMQAQGRMTSNDWDMFDTRHVVFMPAKMTPAALESGYWRAYNDFYKWGSIFRGAWAKPRLKERLRHVAYAGGWKKFEPLWDWVIRAKRVTSLLPMLEAVLTGFGSHPSVPVADQAPNAVSDLQNHVATRDRRSLVVLQQG